jgi:RecB family exonuclease
VQGQLGFDMPRKLIRVTPAKLATWNDCPRKYRMTYLDRPALPRGGPSANATLGAVVHNALRAFFDISPGARTPAAAAALVVSNWRDDGFADPKQAAEYRELAQDWVSGYIEGIDPTIDPIGVERWVSAPVGTIIAEGRVDRIDVRDGELVIVDYKTGRHALTTDDARGSQALAMYAVAARRTLRKPCHQVELHHLPSGTVAVWNHTDETLQRHVRRAEETADDLTVAAERLADGADRDAGFPPTTGMQCSWCDFRRHCPEGQAAAPEREPWAALSSR